MTEEELHKLIDAAKVRYDAMTKEEQDAMWEAQRRGYAKAEASWPKPKFHYEDGVKVYDSYEDYCND